MDRPTSIRTALFFLKSKVYVYLFFGIFITYFLFERPEHPFLLGMADGIFEMTSLENPFAHDPNYSVSFILTGFFYICLRAFLLLYFTVRGNRIGFWVMFVIDSYLTIKRYGIPIFEIILLIIMLSSSARNYFNKAKRSLEESDIQNGIN